MVFTGTYEHSIDAKNRLAIPADIRVLLERPAAASDQPVNLYVTLGEEHALCLYPEATFEKRAQELDESELDTGELLKYERLMFSLARRVELDKQGRVRLPDHLLKMTGLSSEVVLLGVKDHLEIRDRVTWLEHVQAVLAQQPQILMDPRRAMRQQRTPPAAS